MKSQRISGFWFVVCLALLPALGSGQADRYDHFAAGERARAAGQDSVARLAYRESMRDATGKEVADSLTGLAYQWIATMYLNEYEDNLALPYFRRSLAIRDSLYGGPHNERAHIRTNMALSINYIGMQDSARLLLQEANEIYGELRHPDSIIWLIALNELSMHAISREDFGLAYSTAYRAIELCEALPDTDPLTRFNTFYRAATVRKNFGDYAEALALARRAADALPEDDIANRSVGINMVALLERETGDYDASLAHLQESIRNSLGDPKQTVPFRADAHLYLAEHYALFGDAARRDRHEAIALALYRQLGSLSMYYERTQLAEFDIRDGRYAAAATHLDEAVTHLRRGEPTDSPANLVQLVRTLLLRARLHHATGHEDLALSDLHAAFDLEDRLRHDFTEAASRRYLSRDMRDYLDLAIRLHYAAYLAGENDGALWQAYRLSERARAFSLLADFDLRTDNTELPRLREEIARLEREYAWGDTLVRGKLDELRIRAAGILRGSASTDRLVPSLDSSALIRYLAAQRTQLLEYHLADSLQLAFLLSPNGLLQAFPLQPNDRLPEMVTNWNEAIRASAYQRKSLRPRDTQWRLDRQFLDQARALTDLLLPDALQRALEPGLGLCVVPDGALNYLPFSALPLQASVDADAPVDYRQLSYLQDRTAVTYAHSGAFLARLARQENKSYELDVLALAPGFGAKPRVSRHRAVTRGVPLAPLVFNQEEARKIGEMLPAAEVYCDSLATRQRFLDRIGDCRILHLSTHGLVDARHPELSFVAFHQPPGRLDEGELLYYNDLYGLPIDNELTVLSACETSLGQLARGEAPLSFATAFAAAGARSTLTTLWQVDDRATKELMVHFYRQLAGGKDRRTALAAAQDSLRRADYFHPFYWSAPTLYGLTGPIPLAEPPVTAGLGWFFHSWTGLAAALLAVLALLTRQFNRK